MSFELSIAVASLIALLAVLLAWWLYRRRRRAEVGRRLRRPAERLRYPLVLAHGLAGFDQIAVAGVKREYFRGVPVKLTALGAQVYLWARVAYVPIYAAGIPYLRTAVWAVSFWGLWTVLKPLLLLF